MVKEIPLSQGYVALVDDDDYERVIQHKWHANVDKRSGTGLVYARRCYRVLINGFVKVRSERLHHFILNSRERVDHIDLNGLNNQRSNLRFATISQNCANRKKTLGRTSRFKGVFFAPTRRGVSRWRAKVGLQGRDIHIGYFADEMEAARAYDEAAKRLHGEFARLNFDARSAA